MSLGGGIGVSGSAGRPVADHGLQAGLADDDHLQYLLVSGTRAMSGDLDMGSNDVTNVGLVDGVDISAHVADATIHFTEASIDHGSIAGLGDDDHLQYALLLGRAGGQTLIGGTVVGNNLVLDGSSAAGGGRVHVAAPFELLYSEGNTTPADQIALRWRPTFTTAGSYLGGMIENSATITYTNSFYIYASLLDRSVHISNAAAGFQAFTLFNALPTLRNGTFNDIVQTIILNAGPLHERVTSGTSVALQQLIVSASPQIAARVSGAVMTWSIGATGVVFAPKFSTVAGSTVNMGVLTGLQVQAPTFGLFQPSAGIENITAIYGIDFAAMTNVTSGDKVVVRSAMTAAADRYFLQNNGGAQSNFGGGFILNAGLVQVLSNTLGLSLGNPGGSIQLLWDGGALRYDPLVGNLLDLSFATDTYTWTAENFGTDAAEFRFASDLFHFGSAGAVGNQQMIWVGAARTVPVPGGYAAFLDTFAGSLDIGGAAMSDVSARVANALSITLSGGTIADIATFRVGGMTTSGIGTADTAALNVTGRSHLRGSLGFDEITAAALAADVNDYQLHGIGNSQRAYIRVEASAANRNVTGIDAAISRDGDTIWICNVGAANNVILQDQNAGSVATNRIISPTGADYVLTPDQSALVIYDPVDTRWRILWGTGT